VHELPKPSGRPIRPPWLWAAAGVLLVAVIGVCTLRFVTASCAAVAGPEAVPAAGSPPPGAPPLTTVTRGRAYFYNPAPGPGACSLGPLPAGGMYVSLAPAQYDGGTACGSYLNVTGPDGTVRAEVADSCLGCTGGAIDLSRAAFSRIASLSAGIVTVSYVLAADPRLTGPLAVRVGATAPAAGLALQILSHGNPLSGVAVAPDGPVRGAHWQDLRIGPSGYWMASGGVGPGPFLVRVTDVFGHRAVATGVRLLPGVVQRTGVFMYPAATADAARARSGRAGLSRSPAGHRTPAAPAPHC